MTSTLGGVEGLRLDLTHTFQAVRFTPEPMMKNMDYGLKDTPRRTENGR